MIAWVVGGALALFAAALAGYFYARRGIVNMVSEAAEKTIAEINKSADEAIAQFEREAKEAATNAAKKTDRELEEDMNK